MAVKDNVELIKEQLRAYKAKLKKNEAHQNRQETKLKHMMAVSSKKIHTLEDTVEEQKEQIKVHKGISINRDRLTPAPKTTAKDKTGKEPEKPEQEQDPIRYAKIAQILQDSKKKNETSPPIDPFIEVNR